MKCNNKKCKYYIPVEKYTLLKGWGIVPSFTAIKEGGCKYSFCRLKGRKRGVK